MSHPNADFFEEVIHTDREEVYRLEDTNLAQFIIKMAGMRALVEFKIAPHGGVWAVIADTPNGKYFFSFTQDDELTVDQVL